MANKGGRPKTSAHEYFSQILDTIDAKCLIAKEDGSLCNAVIKGGDRYGNNLKTHLSNYHPAERKIVDEKDSNPKSKSIPSNVSKQQSTIMSFAVSKTPYKAGGIEDTRITEAVALFFGGTNCPKSIIEHPLFINLVQVLNSQYTTPGRKKITKSITALRQSLDQKVKTVLSNSKRIIVVLDMWSKSDMTPFIGVTAHCYNRKDNRRYHVTLGLKNLSHPHTAEVIYNKLNDILSYWDIDESKVFKILSDNASNMIKAFSTDRHDDTLVASGEDQNVDMISFVDVSDDPDDEDDMEEDFCADLNLDETLMEEDEENDVEAEIVAFDLLHAEQEEYWPRKHLRCMVHSLQLIVNRFLKEESIKKLVNASKALVAVFRKSSTATERLKNLTGGRILRRYCPTRWSSFYNMADRLLEIQEEVAEVCREKSIDSLQPSQWNQLNRLRDILEPYARFTLELEAYKSTTLSLVVPSIQDLLEYAKKIPLQGVFRTGVTRMIKDLKERFDYVINVKADTFDSTYVIATALDPRYKCSLSYDQLETAKSSLLIQLNAVNGQQENTNSDAGADSITAADGPPKKKRFQFATIRRQTTPVAVQEISPLQEELNRYFNDFSTVDEDADPVEYWKNQKAYPLIADLAIDYLVTPCSSSSVESMFSHAGFLCSGMRSRLSAENLESQVLIKTNFFALK